MAYSNSPLVSYTKISPNSTNPRNHAIDTITIHCVVGQLSVETIGAVFAPSSRQASSNYGVGPDGRVGMYVEEKNRSWCTSSKVNDHRAITIEVASDLTHPYAVTDAALQGTIKLVADICKRNGIKKLVWSTDKNARMNHLNGCNITVHRDYANKSCPGDYLYNRMGYIADEVNAILNPPAPTPVPDLEFEHFKALFKKLRAELQDNDASAWSEDARKWAVGSGIIQGSSSAEFNGMWGDFVTREQLVTMLYRFYQLIKKS